MLSRDYLNYAAGALKNEQLRLATKTANTRQKVNETRSTLSRVVEQVSSKLNALDAIIDTMDKEIGSSSGRIDKFISKFDAYEKSLREDYEKRIAKLEKEIEKLQKDQPSKAEASVNEVVLGKARTIAIFDAILSAITSWSTHGDQASDVEAASQSVVFPSVYNRVMSGDDPAYLLDDVPVTAEIVVQRGREFVKWIRSECETHITTPGAWEQFAPKVQEWWVRDALPLIYGEADPDWEDDRPFSLEEIDVWRNNPADRMMAFPKIHDAMDLLQKHRSEIYDSTRIREFNQHTAQTRLS